MRFRNELRFQHAQHLESLFEYFDSHRCNCCFSDSVRQQAHGMVGKPHTVHGRTTLVITKAEPEICMLMLLNRGSPDGKPCMPYLSSTARPSEPMLKDIIFCLNAA